MSRSLLVVTVSTVSLLLVTAAIAQPLPPLPPESTAGAAAWHFTLARSLSAEGDIEGALVAWRETIELAPEEPYVRLEYARFLARQGRGDEARREVATARRLAPGNHDVLRAFAELHLALSRSDPSALAEAQSALEDLAAARPHDVEALFDLGRVLYRQGRWPQAVEWFERAAAEQPGNRAVQSYRVSALLEAEEHERAIEVLQGILRHDPSFLNGRLQLASLLSGRGEHRRAVEVLGEAPPEQRREQELRWQLAGQQYRIGELEAALETIDAILADDPEAVRERILKALVLSASGRDAEALDLYTELVEERPRNLGLLRELVEILERNDRPAAAEEVLRSARDRLVDSGEEPLVAGVELELLSHLWRIGAWEELRRAAEPAARDPQSPLHTEALLLSVEALHRRGRSGEALEELAGAEAVPLSRRLAKQAEIEFDRGHPEAAEAVIERLVASGEPGALLTAGRMLHRRERYDEAASLLERALDLEPESTEVLYWLGATYERQGEHEQADRSFGRLLDLDPDHAPALNYLGYMWAERGENLPQALELVRRAVAQEPDNGAYVDSLGWTHFQLGNYGEARDLLERAARLVPDDAVIAEHLGDVYSRLGEARQAQAYYRRALELDGDNRDQVQKKLERLRESL